MDYNIRGCVTILNNDSLKIDDSSFPITPLPVIGDEYSDTDLGILVCSSENQIF
jgi:hypothetical protein